MSSGDDEYGNPEREQQHRRILAAMKKEKRMSQTDIVERLRGTHTHCHCGARYVGQCGCGTIWPETCCDEAADTITQLRERLDAVEKAEEEKAILLGRYIAAMWENYPAGWAADPGNPELCIGNIRRFHQEQSDQLRLSNKRMREALKLAQGAMGMHGPCRNNSCKDCNRAWNAIKSALTAESGTEGKAKIGQTPE